MNTDYKLLIHAGAPKCGSSSLQLSLSQRPLFATKDGQKYSYCAILQEGEVVSGNGLAKRAAASPFGYMSSPNVSDSRWTASVSRIAHQLRRIREEEGIPILSSEGWCNRAKELKETGLIAKAGGGAHVIIFVRPPVDWLNSAWWQWGAWSGADIRRFLVTNINAVRWHVHAEAWSRVEGVECVSLRLAERNSVNTFFEIANSSPPDCAIANGGVPPAFFGFLQRNRAYRESAHSPQVEFVVGRHLGNARIPPPWSLSQENVREIFERTPHMPKAVHNLLAPEDRELMKDDRRWWEPAGYANRPVEDVANWTSAQALLDLHAALLAPIDPISRWRLRGTNMRMREAIEGGRIDDADKEIARVLDWILKKDQISRMKTSIRP